MMVDISEYIVFYLVLEGIGTHEDLKSIGVRDESYQAEKIRSKDLADALVELFVSVDKDLRMFEGYAEGVGEEGVRVKQFGPVFIAYVKNNNKESVKALYSMMALRLPRILRKMGMNGRFVRGSFVKGFGWEIVEGDCYTLYGPVMEKAWHVLKEMAYSLRIIIEPEIFKIVSSRSSYGDGKDGDWLPRYARRDFDGQGIFDYLAYDPEDPRVKHDTVPVVVKEMKQTLVAISQIIQNMASSYFYHDNSRSVRMALALRDYVLSSVSLWTHQTEAEILREVDPAFSKAFDLYMKNTHES